jgi:nicotinamide-nucleotide amidase
MTETLAPAIPEAIDALVERLLRVARDRDLTLTTAESCTGGLLSSLLTDVDGYGRVFERGFVTYSNEAKRDLLGVAEDRLKDPGPVSEPVARAMAEGALARSNAHIALSVTGFAGRGGPDDEPGLVHFGLARRGGSTLHRERRFGDIGRGPVRLGAIEAALDLLREALGLAKG